MTTSDSVHPAAPVLAQISGPPSSFLITLGWAAYLACSWTWCIGMFLPALLVRDHGVWGFVVFAVPNVIGAGAMGWVLCRPGTSERLVREHTFACLCFSTVTLAFHAFWLVWLAGSRTPDIGLGERGFRYVLLAGIVVGATTGTLANRDRPWLGSLAQWLLSITAAAVFLYVLRKPDTDPAPFVAPSHLIQGLLPETHLLWLAPVCLFGFALCPYLDLTFHRARQATDARTARTAFTLGFGILFLSMIVFTVYYSRLLTGGRALAAMSLASAAVLAHIGSQTAFTVLAHARQAAATIRPHTRRWALPTILFMLAASAVGLLTASHRPGGALGPIWQYAGLTTGEVVYRGFLSFYGLIFPAYVWLCMVPARGEPQTRRPSARKLTILAISCLLAASFFWMGFIERLTSWLGPGVAIVLLARLFVKPSNLEAPSPATGGPTGSETKSL